MPTFYPRQMPRQHLPLTPPEFIPSYNNNCGQFHQASYGGHPRHHEENGYGYSERYDQASLPPVQSTLMYPQHQHHGAYHHNSGASYYEPVNTAILPPMRGHEHRPMGDRDMHRHHHNVDNVSHQVKEEKPTGGVAATLDYDMELMSEFVASMAQEIIQPGHPQPPSFRKWVHGVLCATRLPSTTIVQGLHYLSLRMTMLSQSGQQKGPETNLHRFLTLGLLLGSKFLDDNTFINRSWSEVSGIPVLDLNQLESEWLAAFDFRLHRDPDEPQGLNSWVKYWKDYELRQNRQTKLAPIDTQVLQYNGAKGYGSNAFSGFGKQLPTPDFSAKYAQSTPAFPSFDPWSARTHDHSPASSAPLTGPTTPEYYGGTTTWAPPEGYSRRTMFGFPPSSQLAPPSHAGYGGSCYPHNPQYNIYNGHSLHCSCFQCTRQPSGYNMNMGYPSQTVVG